MMSKGLFVIGTGTDIGKTYVTGLLLKYLRDNGYNATYFKAALSGAIRDENDNLIPGDAVEVLTMAGLEEDTDFLVPYIYETAVSPHLASQIEGNPVNLDVVKEAYEKVSQKYDYIVMEGSGGIVCPIRYEGKGNENNIMLEDIIKYLCLDVIVIADAGLLSKNNIDTLDQAGYQYILGARPKNDSADVKERILSMRLRDGQVRSFIRRDRRRIVVSMSDARARNDAKNRRDGLRRLERKLGAGRLTKNNINNRGYNKYLRMEGDVRISIDYERFESDAAWDGIKAYVTNSKLPPKKIVANYHNLWFIERAFRMNKTDLRIRPIFHRLRNRIEGHICICFTAYTIMLELERRLKEANTPLSLNEARELTKNIYSIPSGVVIVNQNLKL